MARIIIIGPGAIGLCVGGGLLQAGHDVVFASRSPFETLSVTKVGMPPQVRPAQVVTAPEDIEADADWVCLCVKSHQVAGTADWLKATLGPKTRLAVWQNGVEHRERVAPWISADTAVVPVVVDLPALRLSAGEVEWRHRAKLAVPDTADARDLCDLFASSFFEATATADYITENWKKLCVNAPTGAVLALTGQRMGVLHRPEVAAIARALLIECILVGRAEGADLPDELIDQQMARFLAEDPQSTNSMYEDWLAGRETEWDARNAVIVRKGRQHGIATPVSDILVPLLAAQRP
ncbi:MAG: 2-dehydropantoate 2-reductase [Asticcacaulis sp.]